MNKVKVKKKKKKKKSCSCAELFKHYAVKVYRQVDIYEYIHVCLASAIVRGQLHAPAALSLRNEPPVPIGWKARWASEQVWTTGRGETG
jgi:hypothetical protein